MKWQLGNFQNKILELKPSEFKSKFSSVFFLPDFIVMRWQLIQELLDPMLLPNRVHVGHLVLRQRGEVQMDLEEKEEKLTF